MQGRGRLDVIVVGGAGHAGLPLAVSFASAGMRVGVHDVDEASIALVASGRPPFMEPGMGDALASALAAGRLRAASDFGALGPADVYVVVVGTPMDELLRPRLTAFDLLVDELAPHLTNGALLVLRSTVFPGTTAHLRRLLTLRGLDVDVAFCPERALEGQVLEEIRSLPQIIGAGDERVFDRAADVFGRLGVEVVWTRPAEAEMAKLVANAWRYLKFAAANEFLCIADANDIDYDQVLTAVRHHYPRASDLPSPGFAAGPCLPKDTMQLVALSPGHFLLGQAAVFANEAVPRYIVESLDRRLGLRGRCVGILGMAFKAESDDVRASLSFKLRGLLEFKGATPLCTDPYIDDPSFLGLDAVLAAAEIVIIGAPHGVYRHAGLDGVHVVDLWGLTAGGVRL